MHSCFRTAQQLQTHTRNHLFPPADPPRCRQDWILFGACFEVSESARAQAFFTGKQLHDRRTQVLIEGRIDKDEVQTLMGEVAEPCQRVGLNGYRPGRLQQVDGRIDMTDRDRILSTR